MTTAVTGAAPKRQFLEGRGSESVGNLQARLLSGPGSRFSLLARSSRTSAVVAAPPSIGAPELEARSAAVHEVDPSSAWRPSE